MNLIDLAAKCPNDELAETIGEMAIKIAAGMFANSNYRVTDPDIEMIAEASVKATIAIMKVTLIATIEHPEFNEA